MSDTKKIHAKIKLHKPTKINKQTNNQASKTQTDKTSF
jgi:hypothetical protein